MLTAEQVITLLELEPHPEGGFFRETYRSGETVAGGHLPERYAGDRCFGTAIYYLITADSCSTMHRVASDELFHFHLGDPVTMLHLHPDGGAQTLAMGVDLAQGQRPQVLVPRMVWQGCCLAPGGTFALFSTTVAPGFDFADFELGRRDELIEAHPEHAGLITRLTHG